MIALNLLISFSVFFSIHYGADSVQNRIVPPPLKDVYEYWLSVDYRLTMGVWEYDDMHTSILYLNLTGDQKYYWRGSFPEPGCANYLEYTGDVSRNIIGEGRHRDVIAINDSIPAPPVIAYTGSTLIVHVTNNMDDPISIHWHGLDQRGTFFMDGVPPLTQCPIMHAQTFTYKFKIIDPPGTYWFHGHAALDLGNGLFGALIILDPKEAAKPTTQDFYAVINDWFPEPADFYHKKLRNDDTLFLTDYEDMNHCQIMTANTVRAFLGVIPWSSGLINGRGWHNVTEIRAYTDRLPLEEFHAQTDPNKPIKMRLINAGLVYGLAFSVDGHKMSVVATDAADIRPIMDVDFVHVTPGERYDVILKPLVPTGNKTFAVRIRTMERINMTNMFGFEDKSLMNDHFGLGWLMYDQGGKNRFTEDDRVCTKTEPCKMVNCPFQAYPAEFNRTCINVDDMRWAKEDDRSKPDEVLRPSADRFEQYFLNFGFTDRTAATINRMRFRPPTSPPFMHQGRETDPLTLCDAQCGKTKECACTHHVNLTLGNTVELVYINMASNRKNAQQGFAHPIHLHGHHFHVVKMGWPSYDADGSAGPQSTDILCDLFKCEFNTNSTTALHLSLKMGNGKPIPWHYANEDGYKPVYKDTVHVPFGAYAVVRFKADNPGWWLSHCHILPHHANGMMMFFREGTPEQIPTAPSEFPTCGIELGKIRK